MDERTGSIERDIERTRAEMSETVEAIQERLNPRYITRQMKYSIRDSARGAGYNMMDTVKENPIPALIAGLSIGWLIKKATERPRSAYPYRGRGDYGYSGYQGYYSGGYGDWDRGYMGEGDYRERSSGMRERAGEMSDRFRSRAEGMTEQMRERTGEMRHEARERFDEMGDRMQHMGHEMRHRARSMGYRAEGFMEQNPLAAGAFAMAAGAIVGMAVPGTHVEDEWMGERREYFMEKAREKASETMEKVEHVAKETATQAKETAKREAESEGLTR